MHFLKHNWQLKLVSLAAAVTMSVFVNRQVDVRRRTFVLPITVPARVGQRLVEPSPGFQVYVDVEGPAEYVGGLNGSELRLNFDASSVPPGRRVYVPVSVELPPRLDNRRGFEVDWRPRTIPVKFASETVRTLRVEPSSREQPDGWRITRVEIDPNPVSVSGSEAAVNRVDRVVAAFRVEAAEEFNVPGVSVRALDRDDNDITDTVVIEPAQVRIGGRQERVVLPKRVPVQPVFSIPPGRRVEVRVVPPMVTLIGPPRAVGATYLVETERVVLPPGTAQIQRSAGLVAPGENIQVTPSSVRVHLRLLPQPAPRP